jgi:hypothetical protein
MAKGIWKQASKDDPIFSGKVTISSHSRRKREDKNDKLTDEDFIESHRLSDEKLRELGLLDRDQLIISIPPDSPKKKTEG